MGILDIFIILLIHWFADFVMQTHEQAVKKSTDTFKLLEHTATYSLIWLYAGFFYVILVDPRVQTLKHVTIFAWLTFIAHSITDFFTSRWCRKYFSVGNYHNGFVVVGIDQILHYAQLFLMYIWLS